jgi:hypothetical protein
MAPVSASLEFSLLARFLLQARGNSLDAALIAENAPITSRRVASILRAAVAAGSTADPSWAGALAEYRQVSESFVEALRSRSAFARILADGMRRVPLRTRLGVMTSALVGSTVGEGKPKAVSALALTGGMLDPLKASAIIVLTAEVVMNASPAGISLIQSELRNGVAAAMDGAFFGEIIDGLTPTIASGGITPALIAADLRAMLTTVNTTGAGNLYFASGAAVANGLATTTGTDGLFAFPTMTPAGGELVGVPYLVTDGVENGSLVLADATGIVGEMDVITIDASAEGMLQMDTAPTDPPTAATVLTSLFQTNARAIRAEAWFGVERVRPTAVAILTDLAWGA